MGNCTQQLTPCYPSPASPECPFITASSKGPNRCVAGKPQYAVRAPKKPRLPFTHQRAPCIEYVCVLEHPGLPEAATSDELNLDR